MDYDLARSLAPPLLDEFKQLLVANLGDGGEGIRPHLLKVIIILISRLDDVGIGNSFKYQ